MLNVSKSFLPYIRATTGHRTVCKFGSISSWHGGAGYGLYSGTKWACSGNSESMRAELAPLGIAVTVIEPGYFRTGFLNAGAQIKSEKRIKEYDESDVGAVRATLDKVNNNQPGDVDKGAKVIVDILTKSGAAEGKELPMRVALGADSPASIREKIQAMLHCASWKSGTLSLRIPTTSSVGTFTSPPSSTKRRSQACNESNQSDIHFLLSTTFTLIKPSLSSFHMFFTNSSRALSGPALASESTSILLMP